MSARSICRRVLDERAVTLTEVLMVLVILGVVLAAMTTLFMSASTSQIDQTNRQEAQQDARLALNSLRREIRCASAVTGTVPGSSIKITLGSYCPTFTVGQPDVTWCTEELVAAKRYVLWRYQGVAPVGCDTGVRVKRADHLTMGQIFSSYAAPNSVNRTLAKLGVTLPIDVTPDDAKQRYTVTDTIAIRNGGRE